MFSGVFSPLVEAIPRCEEVLYEEKVNILGSGQHHCGKTEALLSTILSGNESIISLQTAEINIEPVANVLPLFVRQ